MAGVKRYEDFAVWQLSVELRDEIFRLTETGRAARDLKFREQIRDAARSAPRNIAEGFGRFKPRPFAQFVRIARGSLLETRNHLQDAEASKYFSSEDTRRLLKLQVRAAAAASHLIKYLDSCRGDAPTGWDFDPE
jgi:four helix bundle protein